MGEPITSASQVEVGDLVRITNTDSWDSAWREWALATEITWRVHHKSPTGVLTLTPLITVDLPRNSENLILSEPFNNGNGPYLAKI